MPIPENPPIPLSSALDADESPHQAKWERMAIVVLLLLILAFKICYVYVLSINSDEPQHLHVAWGWTQGMVQYRDYFDNHTPLFHMAMAPLVGWLGERADILFPMRIAMMPLVAISLGCIYWLGARLYSRRAGIWAVVLTGTCPYFLLKSSEFRADILWMTAWFAAIAVALSGRFTRSRAFAAGLLLGATFGVSMKTSLLLVSLLTAFGLVRCLLPEPERKALLAHSFGSVLFALAGVCIVPVAIGAYFAAQDALPNLLYCVFEHNKLPGSGFRSQNALRIVLLLLMPPVITYLGRAILRTESEHPLAVQRATVFVTGAVYLLLLYCFWPHLTPQDYLPAVPLVALSIAPWLLRSKKGAWIVLLIALVQLAFAARQKSPLAPTCDRNQVLVQDVLRLTKPSDFVMDSKGETIFRRRPFYYVLETLTQRRMRQGLISDTVADDMARTRTSVCILKRPFDKSRIPEKSLLWVQKHYLQVTDQIWVSGAFLPPTQQAEAASRSFEVAIPANYVVASPDGPVQGTMDGVACAGPVFLKPGAHTFTCSDPRQLAVFWAQASEKGFTPFHTPELQ